MKGKNNFSSGEPDRTSLFLTSFFRQAPGTAVFVPGESGYQQKHNLRFSTGQINRESGRL
jgi:hypothetical protein